MDKSKFRENLEGAIEALMRLTSDLCFNSLSSNYKFLVRPNSETVDAHLNEEEIAFHNQLMTAREKYLTHSEVADLLWTNNKVPFWINTSVLESSDNRTTIELLTSRRLRTENELNKIVDQFPPFHIQVPLPYNLIDGEKFDINWRHVRE
jgi:hypothetical protein